jgi:hypothetical protein
MDKWLNNATFTCASCMYYESFRCKRSAPSIKGYPAVYPDSDWCGEHKISKRVMRELSDQTVDTEIKELQNRLQKV